MYILIMLTLAACLQQEPATALVTKSDTTPFRRDIPDAIKVFHEQIMDLANRVGTLELLDKGYPGLQVRLWLEYSNAPGRQIMVIKSKPVWVADLHTTYWSYGPDSATLLKRTVDSLVPKHGWHHFVDSLQRLEVFTLPDQSQLPNMPYTYNSSAIHFEIATDSTYRYYFYTVPKAYSDSVLEAAKVEHILAFLQREFGFNMMERI